jgi:hypothetical protein
MQRADDEWAEARVKYARMCSADCGPAPPPQYLDDRGKETLEAVIESPNAITVPPRRGRRASTASALRVTERTNAPELRSPLPGRGE